MREEWTCLLKDRYIGSVRFFKNLILLAVIIAILIPVGFAVYYRNRLTGLQAETEDLSYQIDVLMQKQAETEALAELPEPEPGMDSEAPQGYDMEHLAYEDLYPDFYAPQPYDATESIEKTMYLTFDDGPSCQTERILDILADREVKATFFVIGREDEKNQERLRQIAEQGHTIGMHSYSHDYEKIYDSVEAFLDDFYKGFCQIRDVTGVTPTVFRFPGGTINAYNRGMYKQLMAEMLRRGFVPFDWNLSAGDAAKTKVSAQTIVNNVVGHASDKIRGVVLMHDAAARGSTVDALGPMIDELREMGYRFEALTPHTKPVVYGYRY